MSGTSNESSNLAPGIVIGFVAFSLFGCITYGVLQLFGGSLKTPTERIQAGDFSKKEKKIRTDVTSSVKKAQLDAFDEEKVVAAMAGFKAAAQADSSIPVPSLAPAEEPSPPIVEEPEPKQEKVEDAPAEEAEAPIKRKKGKKAQGE